MISSNGYLMTAADGGIFAFSDIPFGGSLGNNPPQQPVIAITPVRSAT